MARMPSLNALRAFEAAARCRSMTRAADELCVTHGAISRQIRALETEFGVSLLTRLGRSVEPTAEGARLAATLGTAFGLIVDGVTQVRPGPLLLSCTSSIMIRWLVPRLGEFKRRHPDVNLRLAAANGPSDMVREGVSVAIRSSAIPVPPDAIVQPLMQEWVGPVCSPEYAHSNAVRGVDDLARIRILHTLSRQSAWEDWAASIGQPHLAFERHEVFEHFYVALHAAACGLGIAVGPRVLVEDELEAGRLVAPFGFVAGRHQLVLWVAEHVAERKDVLALTRWLQQAAAATVGRSGPA